MTANMRLRVRWAAIAGAFVMLAASTISADATKPEWATFPVNTPVVTPTPEALVWSAEQLDDGYVVTPAGCADVRSAEGLNRYLLGPAGPIKGFDSPRVVPLPDGRTLWLLQDPFLDYDSVPSTMAEMRYINSAVLIQDQAGCFTSVAHGNRQTAKSFEPGVGAGDTWLRFWWPAGASAASGQLQIVWVEMTHDPTEGRDPMAGPAIHPIATWLATYDLTSLERLSFAPAPNPGVRPIVAFDAVDDPASGWTYLFGNTFLQNFQLEPVEPFGAHSATVTTLARVPLGHLGAEPDFWTGSGWSHDASAAVPIAQQCCLEHIMHPQLIDGRWWSTTKPNGFLGDTVIVETAPGPQGPWAPWGSVSAAPHGNPEGMLTYAPVLVPWLDPGGEPIVVLSQIDPGWWEHDGGDPTRYRPQALSVPPADSP